MKTTLKKGVGRRAGFNGRELDPFLLDLAPGRVMLYEQPAPPRQRVVDTLGRLLLIVVLLIVAVALAAAGGGYLFFHQSVAAVRAHSKDVILAEPQLHVLLPHQAAVALVVGYDQRAGVEHSNVSRSDTVMLLRADPATHSASLLSFPRDLGVPIYCPNKNGEGTRLLEPLDRINAAYAYCKAAGTLATVEKATGLRINYLVTVNFHGFKEIVDKLGGIWLDIDRRYYNRNVGSAATDYANIDLQPGYQLLDGERALEFVRFRHTDDDYHRVARQQEFVRALKQQFSHNFQPLKFPSLVSTIVHNVEVGGTLSDKDVLNYAWFAVTMPGGHIFQVQIQGITGTGQTTAPAGAIRQAVERFTHPNVAQSKDANAAALRAKAQPAKAKANLKPNFSPAPKTRLLPRYVPPKVFADASAGRQLLGPLAKRVPFALQTPTVLAAPSEPDPEEAARLYWIDGRGHHKAVRLVFRMLNGFGDYWGIEETNMPSPPILGDRSFTRKLGGRTFQFYYSGSHLHMIVLRSGKTSYWVVNTLLDSLSNETMIAIARGLQPLRPLA